MAARRQPKEDEHEKSKRNPRTKVVKRRILADDAQLRALFPLRGIRRQNSNNVVDAALDAAAEIPRLEAWRHRIGDDDFRQGVGQRAFEAVANLDPRLALVWCDKQQHAIVLLLLAELPGAKQRIGVRLDVVAFERI